MNNSSLNLARKWRSKSFDQIVGQELSVRMLKNSLYRDQFFPVYLFSGQRGCGKTSTARIFAAAVNCEALPLFQQSPKAHVVPCGVCASCVAVASGQHPDFFEIDAASHTGVDTIRQLIDSSQLLPVMGRKKIYLIDEAHMLSKASFNALLKILEEPPRSVLFVLATTDPHKIIDTVRSRCFQLFFSPIAHEYLYNRIAHVCEQEGIAADEQGLRLIVASSEGSLRDALNLLEQVRFSSSAVTKQAVLSVLGYLDDEQLITLLEKVFAGVPRDLLSYMKEIRLESYAPERLWERLVVCLRAMLWVRNGVQPEQLQQYEARLKRLVSSCSWSSLAELCDRLHAEQTVFNRTTAKYALLEVILLQVCHHHSRNNNGTTGSAAQVAPSQAFDEAVVIHDDQDDELEEDDTEDEDDEDALEHDVNVAELWLRFVRDVDRLGDPLLKSIFQQGRSVTYNNGSVEVAFSKQFIFFQDWLTNTHDAWSPILRSVFGKKAVLKADFTVVDAEPSDVDTAKKSEIKSELKIEATAVATELVPKKQPAVAQPLPTTRPQRFNGQVARTTRHNVRKETPLRITDEKSWPLAHMLLRHFPGTLTEIGETTHG